MYTTCRLGVSLVVVPILLLAAQTSARAAPCTEPDKLRIWHSPETPVAGDEVRVIAVGPAGNKEPTLVAVGPDKKAQPLTATHRAGPPPSAVALIANARAGEHRIELRQGARVLACRKIEVKKKAAERTRRPVEGVYWKTTRAWDAASEGLFSAWVEALFDAPASESLSFRPLAPAIRDAKRNLLYDHLGLGEDNPKNKEALPAEPDCADLPYFLRAYFAWKLGLPMGFRDCDRGSSTSPPRCRELVTNQDTAEGKSALHLMRKFLRKLANTVHSGSARTALGDPTSDLYPVALDKDALRPGTVYADPYGHVLVLAKWVPPREGAGGLLLAVDGQPDGSIARKRFWEGTFLFAANEKSAGPGWKTFRPLRASDAGGLEPLENDAIDRKSAVTPLSREQETLAAEAFYARMGKLINPSGLPPKLAYEETLAALIEQLETRVGSIDNGEKNARETKNALIAMPEGPKIFETIGPWEDFATPSRDMRLIIAMNVLRGLPARVEKHPELFVLAGTTPAKARAELEALHAQLTKERSIEYKRSDGSPQRLTVAELLARREGFEVAYNPNDCVEHRWGAAKGSPEMATCTRRAPPDQQARMEQYRSWFRDARRPPR